jgi:peptidoglycan/xylan/chitin deacetylase (PgdA/CDA1 family)
MSLNSNPVKTIVKRSLQHLAAFFGRHRRVTGEPQLLVLMYHRILPVNDPRCQWEEPGMIVSPETFKMHLEILRQHFDMIHLSEWVTLKNNGAPLPPRACAITFDDGWADNFEFAYPVLCELDVPATIFLVSDMIGTHRQFWPERLAQLITNILHDHPEQWSHPALDWVRELSNHQFPDEAPGREELSIIISRAKKWGDEEIHARLDKIETELNIKSPHTEPSLLTWEQIKEMNNSGLVEAGSHTCNHTRLTDDTSDELIRHEIIASKKLIEEQTGHVVKTFCFPNGDYSTEALALVREHYETGVSTKKGWNSIATDSSLLNRIGIHEDIAKDKTAFLARISGWV